MLKRKIISVTLAFCTALVFFSACFYRLSIVALTMPHHSDEMTGTGETIDHSYTFLIQNGPKFELNTSPLHYLINKAWLNFWGGQPQKEWNLRFFFRVIPISFYCLFALSIFFASFQLLLRKYSILLSGIVSLAISSFAFSRPYLMFYACQDRPYSLWLFLSTAHLILFLMVYFNPQNKGRGIEYCFVAACLLLVLTAYVSIAQVAFSLIVLIFLPPKPNEKGKKTLLMFCGIISLSISIWYYHNMIRGPDQPSQLPGTFSALLEIFLHSTRLYLDPRLYKFSPFEFLAPKLGLVSWIWIGACVSLPFLQIKIRAIRSFLLLTVLLSLFSAAIALLLRLNGQTLGGPRYLIFMVPYFFGLSIISIFTIFQFTETILHKLTRKKWIFHFVIASAACALVAVLFFRNMEEHRFYLSRDPNLFFGLYRFSIDTPFCPKEFEAIRTGKDGVDLNKIGLSCGRY